MRHSSIGLVIAAIAILPIATSSSFAAGADSISLDSSNVGPAPARAKHHKAARHATTNAPVHVARHARHMRRGGGGGGGGQWGDIAVSLQNGGVSFGTAFHQSSPSAAAAVAINGCNSTGRPGCYTPNNAFQGCGYVSISVEGSDHSAWGISGTADEAVAQCQSQGVTCQAAVGGCN